MITVRNMVQGDNDMLKKGLNIYMIVRIDARKEDIGTVFRKMESQNIALFTLKPIPKSKKS